MDELRFCSLNCRGLKDWRKRDLIKQCLKVNNVDICFLQETHCSTLYCARNVNRHLGGKTIWSFGSNRSKGVGIWFRPGLKFEIISTDRDSEGRMLYLLVKINNQIVKIVNVYAPVIPRERKQFFNSLNHYLHGKYTIILGGDFNCVTDVSLDKCGGNDLYGNLASENLINVCEDHHIVDAFRSLYPQKQEYTWKNSLNSIFCRLDRFYISESILKDVLSVNHEPVSNTISDHNIVQLDIKFGENNNIQTGPGYWKCNTKILRDPNFQVDFENLWECLDSVPEQDSNWWENCKIQFRQLIISHSMRISRISHLELKEAKRDLTFLIRREENVGTTSELQNQIKEAQSLVDKLNENFLEGAKIRSKVKYLETNEKPTRFFLRKEKQSAKDKHIKSLKNYADEIINTSSEITEHCRHFYETLYSRKVVDESLNEYFLKDIPSLSEDSSTKCEGHIILEECKKALELMQNHKSPGPDGLPKEFYTFAFPYIGRSFVKLLNRLWSEGTLPLSQRQCFITLICKDRDNADLLSNWRPISLLNCDYKILSKVLSLRLRTVIGEIVHPDQTCSIPGRTIQDNVHLIRNLIEYVNDKNMSAAIISLDQSKAFDRVSHEYLFKVLHSFGFGPQFISLVKLLYTDIYSSILVNGFVSKEFPVQCSVRQGCSLSPLLYVLCMEPFAHRIRTDPMIKGIPLPGTQEQCKICQYADDTNVFVSDIQSVRKILIFIELFELVSGAKLNKQKTFGMWLGRWRGRSDQPVGLNWTNEGKKFYGVYLGTNECSKKNWDIIISKFQKCVNLYGCRDLSFRGRSTILKAVLCSSIWYVGSLILMPENVRRTLNKLLFTFLWKNQPEAIKRETLFNEFQKGGLNIVDIQTKLESLLVKQVLQLIKGTKAKWKYLAVYWIGLHLRHFVPSFASLDIPHSGNIPGYYKLALQLFRKFVELVPNFMTNQSVSTKFIYKNMLESRLKPPRVQGVHPTIDYTKTWKWIQCTFVDPRYRDLAWRIAHQILPTQSYLYKYNISRNSKCYLCKRYVETLYHLFYECPILNGLWSFVASVLLQLTGCQVSISLKAILFNIFAPHVQAHFNELLLLLINLLKFCIWCKRNQAKHEFKKVTTICIKAFFIRTLSLRIKADFERLDKATFSKYWCKNYSVVRVEGNSIKILLRLHPP